MEVFKIVILLISGFSLIYFGLMRFINPVKSYLKNSGIKLEKEVNLLNEMRSVGTVMVVGGIILLIGIVFSDLTVTSFVVGCLMFYGYALGRIFSIFLDGKPNKLLIQGLIFEIIFGSAHAFALISTLI